MDGAARPFQSFHRAASFDQEVLRVTGFKDKDFLMGFISLCHDEFIRKSVLIL